MTDNQPKIHSFTVHFSLEANSAASARELLEQSLQTLPLKDYRIEPLEEESSLSASAGSHQETIELLERLKQSGDLVRVHVIQGFGKHLSIPCRILNYDASNSNVSLYHVDEKKVYLFKLNEIEDIS